MDDERALSTPRPARAPLSARPVSTPLAPGAVVGGVATSAPPPPRRRRPPPPPPPPAISQSIYEPASRSAIMLQPAAGQVCQQLGQQARSAMAAGLP
eukprot:COSAG01_NODE_6514_length_3626_cov_3.005954_3_plen_97_part_00